MSNTFGNFFRVTTWGESHGPATGAVIDGIPSRMPLDIAAIQADLERRRPCGDFATTRREPDEVQILSGVYQGLTLGTPIMIMIPNKKAKSVDYDGWENLYRPSHGDYSWEAKYGWRDPRSGGRCSARETAARVAAGSVARQLLLHEGNVEILAWVEAIGTVEADINASTVTREEILANSLRCPDPEAAEKMTRELAEAKAAGDSLGGIVTMVARNVPAGWGEPIFNRLDGMLAQAMMSIPAVKGVEIGAGFGATRGRASQLNDELTCCAGKIRTRTNNSGGVQGGLSNGEEITMRVAFKPIPTIPQPQRTVTRQGQEVVYIFGGRHDVCCVPRATVVVEAMAALVLADCALGQRLAQCGDSLGNSM